MSELPKGSHTDLLPSKQAAEFLGVTVRQLRNLSQSGALAAVYPTGTRQAHYRTAELCGLLEMRLKKYSLPEVAQVAVQALHLARSLATKLDEITKLIGLEVLTLPTSEAEVLELFYRAEFVAGPDSTTYRQEMAPHEVYTWAKTLAAVDEHFLALVKEHTGSDEPWKVFMDCGNTLLDSAAAKELATTPSHSLAYGALTAAVRGLRQATYLYLRGAQGPRIADSLFADGFDEEILHHIIAARQ